MTKRPAGNTRADAARLIFNILEQGKSARECLPEILSKHTTQNKAWIQEMVFGVLRELPLLQYWLRQLLDKPLKQKQKVAEHLIMLGFYQLAFSRVSEHAAVSETVNATAPLQVDGLRNLVNAVLRNFIRQAMGDSRPNEPQVVSGLPKWLFKRLTKHYPQELDTLITEMKTRAPIWLRVNQRQQSRQAYSDTLLAQGIAHQCSAQHPAGIILERSTDITSLPGFDEGWFAVQDGAAQLAADLLMPAAGERILDCCAAPGGKTCHLLELQPELTQCHALDVDAARLQRVQENLQRLKLHATLLCGDAAAPDTWWDGTHYDRILLDAPCSATGVIRRHPDIKWLRRGTDIDTLVALQAKILDAIWPLLKPGGTLLYATCSILPEENEQQIEAFLARTPSASISPITQSQNPATLGWQILPGDQQMDGFYYARLLKSD